MRLSVGIFFHGQIEIKRNYYWNTISFPLNWTATQKTLLTVQKDKWVQLKGKTLLYKILYCKMESSCGHTKSQSSSNLNKLEQIQGLLSKKFSFSQKKEGPNFYTNIFTQAMILFQLKTVKLRVLTYLV